MCKHPRVQIPDFPPRALAQFGSAFALGAKGRRFKSYMLDSYTYNFMSEPDFTKFTREWENTIRSVADVVRNFCPEEIADAAIEEMQQTTKKVKNNLEKKPDAK